MKKIIIKSTLIILALAGLVLLANIPNFSSKVNDKNFWYMTEDEITIDKTVHNFGAIDENGGAVSATFTVTNNTKTPIVLTNVVPSCGCTTPEWKKDPIEPGQTGKIVAIFNPKNRSGSFNKSISILTTGKPERFVVRIMGTIESK